MSDSDFWLQDVHKDFFAIALKAKARIWRGKSRFQTLDVVDTVGMGRALFLDGVLMTTERDEFVYHEMLSHVPLSTHRNPETVLIIGGGDGGTLRETLRHPCIRSVDVVEIDAAVVDCSREFLPGLACAFDDPRVALHLADGIQWVREKATRYDVIIVDSTDPVGPAAGLFSADFYTNCCRALTADGLLSAQTQSPFFDAEEMRLIYGNLRVAFPEVRAYLAPVPTYPGGCWSFALASKNTPVTTPFDPRRFDAIADGLRYYNPEVHAASFALPTFVRELVGP